jgi:cytochrome c-type biogenesis protein
MEFGFITLLVRPAALGLLGFIEPCSIGSSLIFVKYLERKEAARKLAETILFAATRALFIGALGVLATLLGTAFLGWQKGAGSCSVRSTSSSAASTSQEGCGC